MRTTLIALLGALMIGSAAAQDAAGNNAQPDEFRTPRTASFHVFEVEGSGVSGTLNVNERLEGGTRNVVTLTGITEGQLYLPVLFRGDCGPDREELTALTPVGSVPNDPHSSITDLELSFEEIAEADLFLYVFRGDRQGGLVACGEVGLGANR